MRERIERIRIETSRRLPRAEPTYRRRWRIRAPGQEEGIRERDRALNNAAGDVRRRHVESPRGANSLRG